MSESDDEAAIPLWQSAPDMIPANGQHPSDDTATLLAAGSLIYMVETLAHEALGHGGMCIAVGLRFTVLAPLWMRCSEFSLAVVAAGPAVNILAACMAGACLRWAWPAGSLGALLLWLCFMFNALVACGYLMVGAATGFGDWPVLFDSALPGFPWRLPAFLAAAVSYGLCLVTAARFFRRFAGAGRLWRRAMVPACGAAVVALAAEIVGGRATPGPLSLALSSTLMVGFSMTSMTDIAAVSQPADLDLGAIHRSRLLIAAALLAAGLFVGLIGPGLAVMPA